MNPASLIPIAGGIFSAWQTGRQNRKNREFQEAQNQQDREFQREMYWNQRQDAVRDTQAANAYNHPLEQMNRLRQAGLNPNLVYGKGAETTSVVTRGASPSGGSMPAPKVDYSGYSNAFNNALTQFQQIKLQQAQTDNIAAQTALSQKQALNVEAGTAKTLQDTSTSKFELEKAKELKDYVIEKARLDNEQTETNILVTLAKNEREELSNSKNVQLTVQQILKTQLESARIALENTKVPLEIDELKQKIAGLEIANSIALKEERIKEIEASLAEKGIDRNNPNWFNMFLRMAIELGHGGLDKAGSQ